MRPVAQVRRSQSRWQPCHIAKPYPVLPLETSGGKVRAASNAIDGADRVAQFLVDATRKRPGAWWREDFTLRFATINGLPGVIVDAPEGPVQTAAFEIEGDVIRALYVVRNPDKLRHLARARHESGPE